MVISDHQLHGRTLSDEEIMQAIRAINRQIKQDFEPIGHSGRAFDWRGEAGRSRKRNASRIYGGTPSFTCERSRRSQRAPAITTETTLAFLWVCVHGDFEGARRGLDRHLVA